MTQLLSDLCKDKQQLFHEIHTLTDDDLHSLDDLVSIEEKDRFYRRLDAAGDVLPY